jgi:hypothetical protein
MHSDLVLWLRAREENRTPDLRITSALLCRLSYSGGTDHLSSGRRQDLNRLSAQVTTRAPARHRGRRRHPHPLPAPSLGDMSRRSGMPMST